MSTSTAGRRRTARSRLTSSTSCAGASGRRRREWTSSPRSALAPELPKFFARYPDINFDLHFNDSVVDLIAEGFEIAMCTGHPTDSRLTTRPLTKGPQVTVAAPAYLERHSVLYPPQRHLPAKLRAFIDFLAQITRNA